MHDLKMTDKVAWHENDGPSKSRGVKMRDMKMQDSKLQYLKMTKKLQDYFVFNVTEKSFF